MYIFVSENQVFFERMF